MSQAAGKIERPKPVSELVTDRLRADIIENRFALGEKVSEAHLSELYGVTKAPVRSAYIRLETEGLLEVRPQSGTFVFLPSVEELRALCELRTALEIEAISLAMKRNPKALARDCVRIVDQMTKSLKRQARDEYQSLDTQLHLVFVGHANSPLLEQTYRRQVNSRFAALRFRFSQEPSHNDQSIQEHYDLRDAIVAGDVDAVRRELRSHIAYTEHYYATVMR